MWAPNEEYEHDVLVPDLRIDLQEQGNPLVILGERTYPRTMAFRESQFERCSVQNGNALAWLVGKLAAYWVLDFIALLMSAIVAIMELVAGSPLFGALLAATLWLPGFIWACRFQAYTFERKAVGIGSIMVLPVCCVSRIPTLAAQGQVDEAVQRTDSVWRPRLKLFRPCYDWPYRAMGCSGSRDGVPEMPAAFGAGSPVVSPPAKRATLGYLGKYEEYPVFSEALYVLELNAYLARVAKHPEAFQQHVQRRRGKC
ncbi:unnamed protein product [Symbiodinium microadriaticum]|nr:unnamed protein product [Symbiodinium microadriaticum]